MGRLLSYFVELIFLIVISKMLGRALQGLFGPAPPRRENRAVEGEPRDSSRMRIGKTERDPVCGMFVSTELSHRLVRGSETLHFCSHECLERYQKGMANVSS
jgi:YHS domain-containing protein